MRDERSSYAGAPLADQECPGPEPSGVSCSGVSAAILCATLFAVTVAAFAAAPSMEAAVALLFPAGVFRLAFSSMAQTIVQLEAPPPIRGRALGLFSMAQMGLQVGSGLTVGVLGAVIGVHCSLGLSGLALAAGTLMLLAYVQRAAASKRREGMSQRG